MIAIDHFAGSGWGVALKQRGIFEIAVENAPAVMETRSLNGLTHPYVFDVWDALDAPAPKHELYLASPPCQTFSPAGAGAGRKALDLVLRAIDDELYRWPDQLQGYGADPRTSLVLAPLAHVWVNTPRLVAWEQVGPVLPVWEACAKVMREQLGYSVWTGYLQAEQYGVPQTRKRAYLIARRDGIEAQPPAPTHSRFYPRDPERMDAGVLPWVSMAEALGWGLSGRPSPTITGGGTETGGAEPIAKLVRYTDRPDWVSSESGAVRLDPQGAAVLQTYPGGFEFSGTRGQQSLQVGNAVPPLLAGAVIDELTLRSNYGTSGDKDNRGERRISQPAATVTGKANRTLWTQGGEVVGRLSTEQASTLQTYPDGFEFAGTKNEQTLHIGNAVPPLLAGAVIDELTKETP